MTNTIRIDPDGTVTCYDTPLLATARTAFDGATSTFTCQPITDGPEGVFPNFAVPLVGVCHDFAYEVTPVCNPKAWALYGRSPIAGPAFFAHDGGVPELADTWIERMRAHDWLQRPIMNVDVMQRVAADNGLSWPELVGA